MNLPAHSRSYKMAKRQLARRPQKYSIALHLVLSLFWFGMALWSMNRPMNLTLCLIAGVISLSAAHFEWALQGYRQIIEEQAKLLEEGCADRPKPVREPLPSAGRYRAT